MRRMLHQSLEVSCANREGAWAAAGLSILWRMDAHDEEAGGEPGLTPQAQAASRNRTLLG